MDGMRERIRGLILDMAKKIGNEKLLMKVEKETPANQSDPCDGSLSANGGQVDKLVNSPAGESIVSTTIRDAPKDDLISEDEDEPDEDMPMLEREDIILGTQEEVVTASSQENSRDETMSSYEGIVPDTPPTDTSQDENVIINTNQKCMSSTVGLNSVENRDKEEDSKTCCHCAKTVDDDMVHCDNFDCSIGWFHYKCVQYQPKSKEDKWFCRECRGDRAEVPKESLLKIMSEFMN